MARNVSYSISNEKSRALRALIAVEWMEEERLEKNTLHCSHQKEEEEGGGGGGGGGGGDGSSGVGGGGINGSVSAEK